MIRIEKDNVQLRVEEKDLKDYLKLGFKKYKKEEKQIKKNDAEKNDSEKTEKKK